MLSSAMRKASTHLAQKKSIRPIFKANSYALFQQNNNTFTMNRFFSIMPEGEVKKRLEDFQELFVEARYCIEDCTDAAETTYFDEEAEAAKEAVTAAVEAFDALINDLDDLDQKNRILRGNGLKVEQLKGELEMAIKGGHDH